MTINNIQEAYNYCLNTGEDLNIIYKNAIFKINTGGIYIGRDENKNLSDSVIEKIFFPYTVLDTKVNFSI